MENQGVSVKNQWGGLFYECDWSRKYLNKKTRTAFNKHL
jgi:hypothetical protein